MCVCASVRPLPPELQPGDVLSLLLSAVPVLSRWCPEQCVPGGVLLVSRLRLGDLPCGMSVTMLKHHNYRASFLCGFSKDSIYFRFWEGTLQLEGRSVRAHDTSSPNSQTSQSVPGVLRPLSKPGTLGAESASFFLRRFEKQPVLVPVFCREDTKRVDRQPYPVLGRSTPGPLCRQAIARKSQGVSVLQATFISRVSSKRNTYATLSFWQH